MGTQCGIDRTHQLDSDMQFAHAYIPCDTYTTLTLKCMTPTPLVLNASPDVTTP